MQGTCHRFHAVAPSHARLRAGALLLCFALALPAAVLAQGDAADSLQSAPSMQSADSVERQDHEWRAGKGAMLDVVMKEREDVQGELLSVRDGCIILNTDTTGRLSAAAGSPSPVIALALADISIVKGGHGLQTIHCILIGCLVAGAFPLHYSGLGGESHTLPALSLATFAIGGTVGWLLAPLFRSDDPVWYFTPGDDTGALRERARYRNGEPPFLRTMLP